MEFDGTVCMVPIVGQITDKVRTSIFLSDASEWFSFKLTFTFVWHTFKMADRSFWNESPELCVSAELYNASISVIN